MKIDLETLKVMRELFQKPDQHMGQVVPVQTTDKDSFEVFRGGLKDNWIFVMALIGCAMFVFNSINDGKSVDAFQNVQIETNIEDIAQANADIEQNTKNIQTLNQTQVANYNDIIIRLNALQASFDAANKAQ